MLWGWAPGEEEGAFGAGFCRQIPSWADRRPGQLGKPPSNYLEAKSDCYLAKQVRWTVGWPDVKRSVSVLSHQ